LGDDLIKKKFDDVEEKVDFLIELSRTLQLENEELLLKITGLEAELENKNDAESRFSQKEALIQSKIDGLLEKLNEFSNSKPGVD
jgi:FtsZ-binding cell division protein ZapB